EHPMPALSSDHKAFNPDTHVSSKPTRTGLPSLPLALGSFAALSAGILGPVSGLDLAGAGSVLEAVLVLGATVGFHELGHFIAARSQGIHVSKFSIGFGPALVRVQRGEVEYALRALPLGGYVGFPDDDPNSTIPKDDPDLLRNRPVADRVRVVIAGVVFNVLLAASICTAQALTVGTVEPIYSPGVLVGEVQRGAIGERAGLQRGDLLTRVGPLTVPSSESSLSEVVDLISENPGRQLALDVVRGGEPLSLAVAPAEQPDGRGRIGVALAPNVVLRRTKASDPVTALRLGASQTARLAGVIWKGLSQLATNFQRTSKAVSGPLGILRVGADVARNDSAGLFQFAALINLNLAIVNSLPLPALDGGYLVFLILEAVRGRKLDETVEKTVMASGLLLLTSLGMFLILRDVVSLGGQLTRLL
ncbi:hypothetical protein APUTEX25_000012, partial [Auxenochlorella protothecoides]